MMVKKSHVLYQLEKPRKKKQQTTLKVSENFSAEYDALLKKPDEEIDFSDIPEINFDKMRRASRKKHSE
jgi:hypothetical protein